MLKLTLSLMLAATLAACGAGSNTSGSDTGRKTLNPPSNQLVDVQPEVDASGKTVSKKVVTVVHQ